MDTKQVLAFAKKHGFDGIIHRGNQNGFDVYEPYSFGGPECSLIVKPKKILVKGKEIIITDEK
ncbi:MAG: hypothetical protein LKE33_05480 [Acidaminococcus sp.]|jgi:hypothetical protein|nr:hypothetical protein [Acidaminococcus sp.]MCI2101125.1 hypothetical protein [Acidaminococcus sp.]MCI2115522.1 hypothetical protein [Acidaminococcus sp.]MCI2117654.1 hypothetical protein [Acidaminococcus sp.]